MWNVQNVLSVETLKWTPDERRIVRHMKRKYGYGVIKASIRLAMADCLPRSMEEIVSACSTIDPVVVSRNVRAMAVLREIKNVGTRRAARYQWVG